MQARNDRKQSVPQGRYGNVSASRIFGKESSEDKTGKS